MSAILIIDDEVKFTAVLRLALIDEGYDVTTSNDPFEALNLVQSRQFELVLTDIRMPRMDGLELIENVRRRSPESDFVIMTAYGSVETAVSALKKGVSDYILKPFKTDELLVVLERILERRRLQQENSYLKESIRSLQRAKEIIGQSRAISEAIRLSRKVAASDANVLLRGESGTGKELFARLIHSASARAAAPLVEINAAAIPEALLESELFGYEKGAFTGAVAQKKGRFELADGGTLFLDEIGDLSPMLQVKLLRAIQDKCFQRVGGLKMIQTNARVIAATNVNLEEAIRSGQFREDLYYRLNVITIQLPPLRERSEDIPLLVEHFLARASRRVTIEPEAMESLARYPWPGNVRELENVIERALVIGEGDVITTAELPFNGAGGPDTLKVSPPTELRAGFSLADWERQIVLDAYRRSGQVKTRTAQALGITRRQLDSRLRRYGID